MLVGAAVQHTVAHFVDQWVLPVPATPLRAQLGTVASLMDEIDITGVAEHRYDVQVSAGGSSTSHCVTVPADLLERWNVDAADEEAVVRESFAFLLEREPASSIMDEFSLSVISQYFPEYEQELPGRLRR